MTNTNADASQACLQAPQTLRNPPPTLSEMLYSVLVFACIGAIAWAIRGTSGWGGIDGTILPGMAWGALWWYLCYRRGVDARGIPLWLGLGIALGGELGYGQYVSWIRGEFRFGDEVLPIAPWIGFAWFAICGIGWGAPGGIALGWALGRRRSVHGWLLRLQLPLAAAFSVRRLIQAYPQLFFPNWARGIYALAESPARQAAMDSQLWMFGLWAVSVAVIVAGWYFAEKTRSKAWFKQAVYLAEIAIVIALFCVVGHWLFFPNDSLGMFAADLDSQLGRTVYTNSQNAIVVAWWAGAIIWAFGEKDRETVVVGTLIGAGFGVGFATAALWCLGYVAAPNFIDWWKMWELQAGFHLGILYAVACYWSLSRARSHDTQSAVAPAAQTPLLVRQESLLAAIGAFLVVYVMGHWQFHEVCLALGGIYAAALLFAQFRAERQHSVSLAVDLRRNLSLIYALFLLLFLMAWGVSSQLGIVLELYDAKAVDQYEWPIARRSLFAPLCVLISGGAIYQCWRIFRGCPFPARPELLPQRMIDLMTALGVVGAISIWPAKISMIYALLLAAAIFAFNRLNCCLDDLPDAA